MYSASYEGGAAATRVPQNYNGNYDFEHTVQDFSSPDATESEACDRTDEHKTDKTAAPSEDIPRCDTGSHKLTSYFSGEELLILGLAAYMFFIEEDTDLALILIILFLIR